MTIPIFQITGWTPRTEALAGKLMRKHSPAGRICAGGKAPKRQGAGRPPIYEPMSDSEDKMAAIMKQVALDYDIDVHRIRTDYMTKLSRKARSAVVTRAVEERVKVQVIAVALGTARKGIYAHIKRLGLVK